MFPVRIVLYGLDLFQGPSRVSRVGLVDELISSGYDAMSIEDFEKLREIHGDDPLKQYRHLFVEVVDSQSDALAQKAFVRFDRYTHNRTVFDMLLYKIGIRQQLDVSSLTVSGVIKAIGNLYTAYVAELGNTGSVYEYTMPSGDMEVVLQHNLNGQVKLAIFDYFSGAPLGYGSDWTITGSMPNSVVVQFKQLRVAVLKATAL